MSRYAIVLGGLVDNVCLWDGDESKWQPSKDTTVILLEDDQPVSPGFLFDGKLFTYGEPPSSVGTSSLTQIKELLDTLVDKGALDATDVAQILKQ